MVVLAVIPAFKTNAAAGSMLKHPWDIRHGPSPIQGGLYKGPFTLLTESYLDVVNITDGFGPEDKLQVCRSEL